MLGKFFGADLFDLKKITNLPTVLLDELSWESAQDTEFFAEGDYQGWPLRIWPVFKRPFIKLNDHYYCFDLYSLFDYFYRVIQRIILTFKPKYREEWNKKQKGVSETLPFHYLEKILPKSKTYRTVFYEWHAGAGCEKQWCETDGLLIHDDHLLIIEVKAGAFTYTSPATDSHAYLDSLKNLVLKPAEQGQRFLEYLNSENKVSLYDKNHKKTGQLSARDYRQITIVTITLDPFTELASQAQHLKKVGIDIGRKPIWSLSIDDLRVYADIFENPLIFLHFLEHRMKAFQSEKIQVNDELDHIGLYLKHNNYTQYDDKLGGDISRPRTWLGYRYDIDRFYTEKIQNPMTPCPLKQKIPARLMEIVNLLSVGGAPGRAKVASLLLECGGKARGKVSSGIDDILKEQTAVRRPKPISFYGEFKLTVFCWQAGVIARDSLLATEHTQAAMLAVGDAHRLLLELSYDMNNRLTGVKYNFIRLANLSDTEVKKSQKTAEVMRAQRIDAAKTKKGKIGRNDPCPCGKGKKYKRCCGKM